MEVGEEPRAVSQATIDLVGAMESHASAQSPLSVWSGRADVSDLELAGHPGRLNLQPDDAKNGLGRLVLAVVKLLHEVLERQAIHRIEGGSLTETEVERLGMTLMRQAEELDRLRRAFNLEEGDLNIDLGPLGALLETID
jgi:hypothetical protein